MPEPVITLSCPVVFQAATGEKRGPRRFNTKVYGGGPMELEGWALPVTIDIQGIRVPRPAMPLYLGHDDRQIVGHTDTHDKTDGRRFEAAGVISGATTFSQQVLESHDAGFPWQVSISARPVKGKIEQVYQGQTAQANGRTVKGPAIIARAATLRHIAIVPEGADSTTSLSIAAKAAKPKRRIPMEFQEWIEGLGFSLGELTEDQQDRLQAKFDAEVKAAKKSCGAVRPIQAARSEDDGFSLPDILLVCEQHNAKIECERTKYLDKVPQKKGAELHQKALQAAADMKIEALNAKWPSAKAEVEAVKKLADYQRALVEAAIPVARENYGPQLPAGEQFASVLEASFCGAAGLQTIEKRFKPEILEAAHRCGNIGLQEMLLQCAQRNGYVGRMRIDNSNLREVMQAAFSTHTVTTLLTQAGDKFLLDGFERVTQRWREVASTRSVSNFRQHTGFRLTADMEYQEVPASGELQHGGTGQESWTIQAKTYGRIFTITRADIINDDLGAFDQLRTRIGMGGAIKMNKVFWTAWLAAVNGAAFWTSARANYQSGATTALGDASLSAAVTLFRQMATPDGNLLDLEPDRLLVPPELEAMARKLYVSQEMRDTTANTRLPTSNIHQNRFRPIIVPELSNSAYTGYSTTHWFLCADPRMLASAEMAFLNGREVPTVESSEADFNTLGISLRAYHDFGVAMSEYRPSVLSAGA